MSRSLLLTGIFVSIVSICTVGYITLLSGKIISGSYIVYANFNDGNGITANSAVKISGIKIGRVKSLKLIDDKARITLEISKDITLYADDLLKKTSRGIVGAGFLEIIPRKTGPPLTNGDELTHIQDSSKLSEFTSNATIISKQIKDYITDSGILEQISTITKQMEQSLESVYVLAQQMNKTVETNSHVVSQITQSISMITKTLETFLTHNNFENPKKISKTLDAIEKNLQNIETVTGSLRDGSGTIGKLLTDETLYNNLNAASTNIAAITNRAADLATTFDYRLENLFSEQGKFYSKNHVNVRIKPQKSPRYYQVGITHSNLNEVTNTSKSQSNLKNSNLKINLILAQNFFKNHLVVRGGIIENSGGIGVDINPFKGWEISAEAFNFGHDDNTYLRAYTSIYPFFNPKNMHNPLQWLYFSGGSDNILSKDKRTYFFSVGIRIQDTFLYDTIRLAPLIGNTASLTQ